MLGLFGDVATEVCIRTDGDEGLFASYSEVQFRAPVQAGDVVEVEATVTRVGTRSRELALEARVVCRGAADGDASAVASAAVVLDPPLVAVTAVGTVVVPARTLSPATRPRSMAHSGDVGARVRADTPKPLSAKGKSLRPDLAAPTCGFVHRRRSRGG